MNASIRKQVVELFGGEIAGTIFDLVENTNPSNFIGVRNYISGTSARNCISPEIANHVIQLGHKNSQAEKGKKDYAKLQDMTIESILELCKGKTECNETLALKAKETLLGQLKSKFDGSPRNPRSQGQVDAYLNLGNGFSVHIEKRELHFSGYVVTKNVVQKGVYTPTNKKAQTKVQDLIKKELNFLTSKFRTYKFNSDLLNSVSIQGEGLELV